MKTAIIYIRVSKESKYTEGGASLENQLSRCEKYCEFKGMSVLEIIKDDGISGFKTEKRPGWVKMLEYIDGKKCDAIVCYSLSRFARNTVATISTIDKMREKGIDFHSLTDSIDTGSAVGKMFLTMIAAVNQFERDITSERTKSVLQMKKSKGEALGVAPYGFVKHGMRKESTLVPSASEQYNIQMICKMSSEGRNLSQIAQYLNSTGVKTRCGGTWKAQQISNVLKQTT